MAHARRSNNILSHLSDQCSLLESIAGSPGEDICLYACMLLHFLVLPPPEYLPYRGHEPRLSDLMLGGQAV